MPEHPDFEIMARIPTAAEGEAGVVEPWTELILSVTQEDYTAIEIELTRDAGEAVLEAVNQALHPWSGVTIREQIWEALDEVMERLMSGAAEPDDRGQAQGLAMALAIFLNPYSPRIDVIKEEAMERWQSVAAPQNSEDDATDSVEGEGDSSDEMPFG